MDETRSSAIFPVIRVPSLSSPPGRVVGRFRERFSGLLIPGNLGKRRAGRPSMLRRTRTRSRPRDLIARVDDYNNDDDNKVINFFTVRPGRRNSSSLSRRRRVYYVKVVYDFGVRLSFK